MGRIASVAALAVVLHGPAAGAATIPSPTLIAGRIVTPSVRVGSAPGAPRILIKYTAPGGFKSIDLQFTSPNGHSTYQAAFGNYAPGATQGALVFQNDSEQFSLYSQPGAWTLSFAALCGWNNYCSDYSAAQLAALFPSPTLMVRNDNPADTTAPTLIAAKLVTRTVSLSSADPSFKALVTASDDVSGFAHAQIELLDPSNSQYPADGTPPVASLKSTVVAGIDFGQYPNVKTGTWTISGVCVNDVAANGVCTFNAADIQALFGTTKFEVTQ